MVDFKSKPVTQTFVLKADPNGKATVTFRQGTFQEDKLRSDYFGKTKTEYLNDGTVIVHDNRNPARQYEHEIFVTISGTTEILIDGKEAFSFKNDRLDMSETEFSNALGKLPSEVILEFRDYVYTINPTWGTPRAEQDKKQNEDEKKEVDESKEEGTSEGESNATSD